MTKSKRWSLLIVSLLLFLTLVLAVPYFNDGVESAQTPAISPDAAVDLALRYAADDGPIGGLKGKPTEIRGKVMSYEQANYLITGRAIPSNTARSKIATNRAWIIVFFGNVIEHVPAALGNKNIPAKDIQHNEMAVILDGVTGDIIERALFPATKELNAKSLPVLTLPNGLVSGIPTGLPIRTVPPLPTLASRP